MKQRINDCKHILHDRANVYNDIYLNQAWRLFYTIKALICTLLDLQPDVIDYEIYEEYVQVAWLGGGSYYIHGEPTTHWGVGLFVGRGVFCEWFVFEESVSD